MSLYHPPVRRNSEEIALTYAKARLALLTAQCAEDQKRFSRYMRTGEPEWLGDHEKMLRHRINMHTRIAERDFLAAFVSGHNPNPKRA